MPHWPIYIALVVIGAGLGAVLEQLRNRVADRVVAHTIRIIVVGLDREQNMKPDLLRLADLVDGMRTD